MGSGGSGGAWKRQQSPERGLEQCERVVLPPRDTISYRGATEGIIEAFCIDRWLLTTVQSYSCGTVASSFLHS